MTDTEPTGAQHTGPPTTGESASAQIYVLNGPNLNRLGRREPEIYGYESLADVEEQLVGLAAGRASIVVRQSNAEGELIDWIQEAIAHRAQVILNPGAFTHYSYGLRDAVADLTSSGGTLIEIHLSNPASREAFRRHSVISPVASGVIAGFGLRSYSLALEELLTRAAAER